MIFKLFDNRILAPLKCGTRYLSKVFEFVDFNYHTTIDFSNIEYLIIREPYEQLKSALHTEYMIHKDVYGYDMEFGDYLDKLILQNYCAHWTYDMYEQMCWMYIKSNKRIKIIHLSDLTNFIKNQGYTVKYKQSNYNFTDETNMKIHGKEWVDKNYLFDKLLKEFGIQMQILLKKVDIQTMFYNKMIHNELYNLI
jgi:hypothetical protein